MKQTLFILACIFLFAPYVLVFALSMLFICFWSRKYNTNKKEPEKVAADKNVFSEEWIIPNQGQVATKDNIKVLIDNNED
jgi:hypothetical protein